MTVALEVEYEPPDKPVTKANARFEILLSVAELAPKVVEDLFNRCYASFIDIAKHKNKLIGEDTGGCLADWMDFQSLADDVGETDLELNPNTGLPEIIILGEVHKDKRALRQCLIDWGNTYGLTADWCYEFGVRVLRYSWQEQQTPKTQKPEIGGKTIGVVTTDLDIMSTANGPLPDRSRFLNLLKSEVIRKKAQIPALSSQSGFNLPGEIRPTTPEKTIKEKEEGELKKAKITFEKRALKGYTARLKENTSYRNSAVSNSIASLSWPIKSWVIVANKQLDEAQLELTVPEERFDTNIRAGDFFLGSPPSLAREKSRLKPPPPPEYVSPIAGWQPDRQKLISKKNYEQRIQAEIWVYLNLGITKNNPKKRLESWSKKTFESLKPSIDEYWSAYVLYLKTQGWVKVDQATELRKYCQWLILYVVCGHKLKDFAIPYTVRYVSGKIRKAADWADLLVPDRRGHR